MTLSTLSQTLFLINRGEEDESLAIKPPQLIARKDKSHNRKEEKRKDKRRHRSHSDDGGMDRQLMITDVCFELYLGDTVIWLIVLFWQGKGHDPKKKKKSERVIAGNVSGRKTKQGESGRDRNEGKMPELIHEERG